MKICVVLLFDKVKQRIDIICIDGGQQKFVGSHYCPNVE